MVGKFIYTEQTAISSGIVREGVTPQLLSVASMRGSGTASRD